MFVWELHISEKLESTSSKLIVTSQLFMKIHLLIIMYIKYVLIRALSTHIIHTNLNTMSYTHVEHSPTNTIYIRYYVETHTHPD